MSKQIKTFRVRKEVIKEMENKKTDKSLVFISRHKANDGQVALAKQLGYNGIEQIDITFSEDPIKDIENAKITEKTISIVAPSYITNQLLNAGYEIIEFVNSPVKREKMIFCCEGAYIYYLTLNSYQDNGIIIQEYIPCPIPIEEQVESSLVPEKREG